MKTKSAIFLIFLLLALVLGACSDNVTPTPASGQTRPAQTAQSANPSGNNRPNTNAPTPGITLAATPTNLPVVTPTVTPAKGGNVVGARLKDASTLHYYKNTSEAGFDYLKLLFAASLTKRNPTNLAIEKNAAENWTVDNAKATVTFTLKNGIKWSDGTFITSEDYLWTYQQARKPENKWPFASVSFAGTDYPDGNGIESMTALDARTLVVKLKTYTFDIVSRADVIQPLPRHIWQKYDWNDAAKNPEINKPTVVSGPWLLKDWKQGDLITFGRNTNSNLYPIPYLDSLLFKIVTDAQVAWEKIRAEEIDFFSPEASDQSRFEELDIVQAFKWFPGQATWQYIGFNFRKPLLQDKILRQALTYATDRKTILDKYEFGLGKILHAEVPPWHPYYYDGVTKYEFNLDKAKDVLQKAGYTLQNGKLATKSGQEIPPLRLVYNTPSLLRDGIAQTIRQNYAALGLQVEIQTLDYSSYVKLMLNDTSDYDLFLAGWQNDFDPENFGEVWRNVPELNNGAYRNDEVNKLYATALIEPDANKRRLAIAQIQQIQSQELPYIYLHAEQQWLDVSRRVNGIVPTLLGVDYNLYTDWFVVS